jgi:transposase InsO family protein
LGLILAQVPSRLCGEVKEGLLKLVDGAVAAGWPHVAACRTLGVSDVRMHRWRLRLDTVGTLEDRAPGGNPTHRLLRWEIDSILELIEKWGPTDRTHRKLAHRGSYLGIVFVSPSTVLRIAESEEVTLPGEPARATRPAPVLPEIPWEPNRIWIWDATHFTRADRAVYAIIDVVSRFWIGTLSSTEQTTTQVQLLFTEALDSQGLLGPEGEPIRRDDTGGDDGPVLVAWSDNGPEMTAGDTRTFMALMAILQHHGRPGTPTDQAHIESFFSHLKREWPHLERLDDPAVLDTELTRIRTEYNTVRLHEAIGYVTPNDEHHGRGPAIRRARSAGMKRARQDRIDYNRQHPRQHPPEAHP